MLIDEIRRCGQNPPILQLTLLAASQLLERPREQETSVALLRGLTCGTKRSFWSIGGAAPRAPGSHCDAIPADTQAHGGG